MIEALINPIYDAALCPERWDDTVQRIAHTFGGAKVFLLHGGVQCLDDGGSYWSAGIDPATYRGPKALRRPEGNPALRIALAAPVGHVFDRREFITDEGMDRHALAYDFFRPNGMFHLVAAPVQKDADSVSLFFASRTRTQAPFEGREPAALAELIEHLGRAMRTHRTLRLAEARGLAFAEALDRLRQGVILADSGLRVLHTNRAAEAMLAAADGLALRLGRLAFAAPRAQAALEAAARQLAGSRPTFGETRLALPRVGEGAPRQVTIVPSVGDGPSAVAPRAQLMIIVTDQGARPDPEALGPTFGLTRAESRVAALASGGATVETIAARLGVSVNTVKAQLKAVYLKIGAGNRTELYHLLLNCPH